MDYESTALTSKLPALSYVQWRDSNPQSSLKKRGCTNSTIAYHTEQNLVRLEGFEPPTSRVEAECSIQLSYRRDCLLKICGEFFSDIDTQPRAVFLIRVNFITNIFPSVEWD